MLSVPNNAVKSKWKFSILYLLFLSFSSDRLCFFFLRFISIKNPFSPIVFSTFSPSLPTFFPFFSFFPSFYFSSHSSPPSISRAFKQEERERLHGAVNLTPLNEGRSVVVQVPERVCTLASNSWTRTSVAVAGVGRKRFGSDYVRRRGGDRGVRSSRVLIETGVVSDRPPRRVELPAVCNRSLRARS